MRTRERIEVRQIAATGIFYLTTDCDGVKKSALELLPPSARSALGSLKSKTAGGLSGYLLGVNPFDQPGVEAYKKNMFALLGKPGY